MAIIGKGDNFVFVTGEVQHNDHVPIPEGFTIEQCLITLYPIKGSGGKGIDPQICYMKNDGVCTIGTWIPDGFGGMHSFPGKAIYKLIGIR